MASLVRGGGGGCRRSAAAERFHLSSPQVRSGRGHRWALRLGWPPWESEADLLPHELQLPFLVGIRSRAYNCVTKSNCTPRLKMSTVNAFIFNVVSYLGTSFWLNTGVCKSCLRSVSARNSVRIAHPMRKRAEFHRRSEYLLRSKFLDQLSNQGVTFSVWCSLILREFVILAEPLFRRSELALRLLKGSQTSPRPACGANRTPYCFARMLEPAVITPKLHSFSAAARRICAILLDAILRWCRVTIFLRRLTSSAADDAFAFLPRRERRRLPLCAGQVECEGSDGARAIRSACSPTGRCVSLRADATPMQGFEQDDYVRNGPFANLDERDRGGLHRGAAGDSPCCAI